MLHFFDPAEELQKLTRDDSSAFAPPPAFGPFRVLHQVGVGALGPVFRTYEPTRDRLVAVKAFRLDIPPEQAQSLADELTKAAEAGLFHPSVVEPIAAGVEGTVAYRADEYVAAETLDVAMRHYAPAPIEKALPFITQLAGAIDFAHAAGIGHGALHPRDIFVTPDEARASGFGVVEALERVGLRAPVRRPYTAPERVEGEIWGRPADVFSLAVVAFELLTGRRPAGMGAQIGTITGGRHAAAIHAVLVRAMDEDPARRYQSALAFASALDEASRGESVATSEVLPIALADDDEGAGQMAPVLDERAEPIEAEQEEDAFRVSRLDLDDIASERDEDHAHAALTLEEQGAAEVSTPAADFTLFEDEAVEDLALEPEEPVRTERFGEEFAHARIDAGDSLPPPAAAPTTHEMDEAGDQDDEQRSAFARAPFSAYAEEPLVVPQREGPGFLTMGITVVLALLVGFAAGYAVGGRAVDPAPDDPTAATSGTASESPAPSSGAAKPYSEQSVAPPRGSDSASQPAPGRPPAAEGTPPAAKPSSPATEVATSGRIDVQSTPPGAGVTVDGRWRGRTPLTLSDLRFGSHDVRVVQPGYATAREEVTLSSSAPSRALSFSLQRATPEAPARPASPTTQPAGRPGVTTGTIFVDSRPRGATVIVDGKAMGTTPVLIPDIPAGAHVVRLQLADHQDWTLTTQVVAGRESRVRGSLDRIR